MKKSLKQAEETAEIEKLEDALEAEQAKSKEYLDRLKYLQADFENYRKRVEKESQEVTQRSNEKLIASLLDVLDDLEEAIKTGKTTDNANALLEGVEMVYKKLYTILEREGLTKLEATGKPFDPNIHEILVKVPTKDHTEGTVIEEARKGFMLKGKIIRPTVVKIACKEEEKKNE